MYEIVRQAAASQPAGAPLDLNKVDAEDLCKLNVTDLRNLGYEILNAEAISSALLDRNYGPLGQALGINFVISHTARRRAPD